MITSESIELLIDEFEELQPFTLDYYQRDSCRIILDQNKGILSCLPTSAGKTIIAEFCIWYAKRIGKKAIFTNPLKALSTEKLDDWSIKYSDWNVVRDTSDDSHKRSEEYYADYDVLVTTNERLESILRKKKWIKIVFPNVLFVMYDEVHLLGSKGRGSSVEATIMSIKLMMKTKRIDNINFIGLSATLPNSQAFGDWWGIPVYQLPPEDRPVPLYHDYDGVIEARTMKEKTRFKMGIVNKLINTYPQDNFLLFVSSRKRCTEIAWQLADTVKRMAKPEWKYWNKSELLEEVMKRKIAWHNAGLTAQQRKLVESAFKGGNIKRLVATPTLCLHPQERVHTKDGFKLISDLRVNDEVLTHVGSYQKVLGLSKSFEDEELIRVTPYYGMSMTMTKNHRVLVSRAVRKSSHSPNKGISKHWTEYGESAWIHADELMLRQGEKRDMLLVPRIKQIVDNEMIDNDILDLAGYFISEGCVGDNGAVYFAISTLEDDFRDDIIDRVDRVHGKNCTVKDGTRHRRVIYFCSKEIMVTYRDMYGRGAYNKKIPDEWLFLPYDKQKRLLRALWRGDGTFGEYHKNNDSARYVTASEKLARQMWLILTRLGYISTIRLDKEGYYRLAISGKQLKNFCDEVLNRVYKPRNRNRSYNIGYIDDNYLYMPIRKLEIVEYKGEVYNIEVEGDHSYVGNFTVHNSQGVNLPARRVILFDLSRWNNLQSRHDLIAHYEIIQSAGRAGRRGSDDRGDAHYLGTWNEVNHARNSVENPVDMVSVLEEKLDDKILALVVSDIAHNRKDIVDIVSNSFAKVPSENAERTIDFLVDNGFLKERGQGELFPKPVGSSISARYLLPRSALAIKESAFNLLEEYDGSLSRSNGKHLRDVLINSLKVPEVLEGVSFNDELDGELVDATINFLYENDNESFKRIRLIHYTSEGDVEMDDTNVLFKLIGVAFGTYFKKVWDVRHYTLGGESEARYLINQWIGNFQMVSAYYDKTKDKIPSKLYSDLKKAIKNGNPIEPKVIDDDLSI